MKNKTKDPKEIRLVPKGCNPRAIRMGLRPAFESFIVFVGYVALLFLMGLLIFGGTIEKGGLQGDPLLEKRTGKVIPDFFDSEMDRRWDGLK